ncbi:hypothetical protein PTSG_08958 [Salpingoeca rosetta]|uniref:C3H1-type domain-containing protein n=1 Tax=Salpingoeca rosetta (strain ATCC 50818 / BSB-021) TaxID=946362 RepID=F2ULT1_SALR5|nr:uncharacterized protein PTSG_08958 [Salpingoeca rosetta]EGD78080.1 hypothetical protein PTSG_08958 [Salpingoeca rosetta]|eukprot:XP_004989756.1 hypothetical protein PTSG_08958 [Salpingoeca rosetta]
MASGQMKPVGIEELAAGGGSPHRGRGGGRGGGGAHVASSAFAPSWRGGSPRGRGSSRGGFGAAHGMLMGDSPTLPQRHRPGSTSPRGGVPFNAGLGPSTQKTNCLHFVRFGQCRRGPTCAFAHDPASVAVCPRYLTSACSNPCPRQHQAIGSMVPDCVFFSRGKCDRDNCRYRHVRLDEDALVCEDFVFGKCKDAACPNIHEYICPGYFAGGTCTNGR